MAVAVAVAVAVARAHHALLNCSAAGATSHGVHTIVGRRVLAGCLRAYQPDDVGRPQCVLRATGTAG